MWHSRSIALGGCQSYSRKVKSSKTLIQGKYDTAWAQRQAPVWGQKKKDLIWLQTKTDSESSPFGATTERRKCVSLFPEFFSSQCELTECKYESLERGREETHPKADESATLGWTGLGGWKVRAPAMSTDNNQTLGMWKTSTTKWLCGHLYHFHTSQFNDSKMIIAKERDCFN